MKYFIDIVFLFFNLLLIYNISFIIKIKNKF